MDIQTIISVLGWLGFGGIIGGLIERYFQYRLNSKEELKKIHWDKFKEIELRAQGLNENKYRSTLVFMRCVLKPENVNQFHIEDPNIQHLKNKGEVEKYAMTKLTEFYYNSILYASDDVLRKLKQFMSEPSESNFMETAIVMRKGLWNIETEIELKIFP